MPKEPDVPHDVGPVTLSGDYNIQLPLDTALVRRRANFLGSRMAFAISPKNGVSHAAPASHEALAELNQVNGAGYPSLLTKERR